MLEPSSHPSCGDSVLFPPAQGPAPSLGAVPHPPALTSSSYQALAIQDRCPIGLAGSCSWGSLSQDLPPYLSTRSASACTPPGQHPPLFPHVLLSGWAPSRNQPPSLGCGPIEMCIPKYPCFYLLQPQTTIISQISHLWPYKEKGPDAAEPNWIRFQTRTNTLRCVIKALFQRGAPAGGCGHQGTTGLPCAKLMRGDPEGLGLVSGSEEQPALPTQASVEAGGWLQRALAVRST